MNKLNRKKIGIDLDDTIWIFHEKFIEFYNNKFNTKFNVGDFNEYNLIKFLNINEEELHNLFLEFEKDDYKILPEIENARDSIIKLSSYYDIYFVTARPFFYDELIKFRLRDIFNLNFPVFYQYDENRNKIKEKVDFCIEEGISIMIDDALHNLIPMARVGIDCYLLDYPWNRVESLSEKIIRVKNWEEILNFLEVEDVN